MNCYVGDNSKIRSTCTRNHPILIKEKVLSVPWEFWKKKIASPNTTHSISKREVNEVPGTSRTSHHLNQSWKITRHWIRWSAEFLSENVLQENNCRKLIDTVRTRKYLWPLNHLQTHHNPSFLKKKVARNVTDQKFSIFKDFSAQQHRKSSYVWHLITLWDKFETWKK